MSFETITVTDANNVRTITLNRSDAMNGINEQMTGELAKALKGVVKEKSLRCLLLTGAGKAFCVGQDLKEAVGGDGPMDFAKRLRTGYNPVVQSLMSLKIPTVAAVNGAAAGAGWSLALACDFRIAANSAKFVAAFSNIGLVPDSAMTWTLPRIVGYAKALEIAFFSEAITADDALALGLVNRVVETESIGAAANEFAVRLASRATRGLMLTKQALIRGMQQDVAAQLEYEAMLQSVAGRSKDYAEGVKAFIDKRKPEFAGE